MAFSIVQHQTDASGDTSAGLGITTALTWTTAPTKGNLLVFALTFRSNATVTESTTQGWIKAVTITNGTTCQTEIWYRVAGVGEGTAGPAFILPTNILCQLQQAEVTGFTGTPTLDRTGTATGTTVSALATAVSAITTAASEFVFGCCGDTEGGTAGVTFNASTSGGGATLGGDIDTVNPAKNGEGLRDTWATSGASGTSPSITFNVSSTSNTRLSACIATFQNLQTIPNMIYGTRYAPQRAGSW